jgi:hypothetical protein
MKFYGIPLNSMEFHGIFHGIPSTSVSWNSMEFHGKI